MMQRQTGLQASVAPNHIRMDFTSPDSNWDDLKN